jgi:hypothetical protein
MQSYIDVYNIRYDDDDHHHHVDGVSLRLWTAATNGPIFHPPGDTYDHGEPWWNDIDRRKLPIRPPNVSSNYASRVI